MANLWPDGQKSHKSPCMRVSLPHKMKPDNHPESCMVDVAGRWRERTCEYPGRSVRNALKGVTIAESNAERTEVSRGHSSGSFFSTKDRINRSLKYDPERRNGQWV